MTIERKEDRQKEDRQKEEKPESVEDTAPQLDMSAIADLTATVCAMGKQLNDLNAAIAAIANQGAVNESIEQDNHETDKVEYPTIDIDGINRLLGV